MIDPSFYYLYESSWFFFLFLERGGDRLIVWKYRERKKREFGRSFFGRFDLVLDFYFYFLFFSFPKYLIFLLLIINSFFFSLYQLGKENLESFFLHDLIWFRYSLVFLFLFSYFFSRMEIYCCACDRCFIRINLFCFFFVICNSTISLYHDVSFIFVFFSFN